MKLCDRYNVSHLCLAAGRREQCPVHTDSLHPHEVSVFFLSYHPLCVPSLFPVLPSIIPVGSIHFLSHIIYLSHFSLSSLLYPESGHTHRPYFSCFMSRLLLLPLSNVSCFMSSFGAEMREGFDPVVQRL